MTNEPLDRCVCNGVAGYLFEDRRAAARHVAIGCAHCGTRTEIFPADRIDDAIVAWETGEFAQGTPTIFGETAPARTNRPMAPRFAVPRKLRT